MNDNVEMAMVAHSCEMFQKLKKFKPQSLCLHDEGDKIEINCDLKTSIFRLKINYDVNNGTVKLEYGNWCIYEGADYLNLWSIIEAETRLPL